MGSMWLDPNDDSVFPIANPPAWDPNAVNTNIQAFPQENWGSDFRAMLVMIEFMGPTTDWFNKVQIPAPNKVRSDQMMAELADLVKWQTDGTRAARMAEIIAQSYDFQNYIVAQLGISSRSHPNTYLMLKMGARVGELVMVVLKNRWKAGVRPSQLYPLLFPPVPVPGHSTYPSGHALISKMMAFTAGDIVPIMANSVGALADRIAFNREAAGLHFASDSLRGKEAAAKAFPIFQNIKFYKENLPKAQAEWA